MSIEPNIQDDSSGKIHCYVCSHAQLHSTVGYVHSKPLMVLDCH